MGGGAAGQPMNSDNTSWPFTSPAGRDASKPHEIDLYIEPSPRDSPTALPKLFTTLEPEPLASAHERERPRRGGPELDAAVARLPHDAADAGGRDESRG